MYYESGYRRLIPLALPQRRLSAEILVVFFYLFSIIAEARFFDEQRSALNFWCLKFICFFLSFLYNYGFADYMRTTLSGCLMN